MPRKRDRKVLYEVTTQALKKKKSGARLENVFRKRVFNKKKAVQEASSAKKTKVNIPGGKLARLDFGKLGLKKVPLTVKAAIVAVIVVFGLIIWAGREMPKKPETGEIAVGKVESLVEPDSNAGGRTVEFELEPARPSTNVQPKIPVTGPPKDHIIVIATYGSIDQLEPVAGYFNSNGIETEISSRGTRYRVVTKDRFLKPGDPQSKLNTIKKQIVQIGDGYKPSKGFLSFKFDDVYAEKVVGFPIEGSY